MAGIKVIQPGLLTTVQDLGFFGCRQFGLPQAGALDGDSHRLANRLVGNPDEAASLEFTFMGPEIEFQVPDTIAITGGHCQPFLNGQAIQQWETVPFEAGDRLTFGPMTAGVRGYIAFRRQLQVPLVLGSRSTHLRGQFGGFQGRKLQSGDQLDLGPEKPVWPDHQTEPLAWSQDLRLRLVLGPQADAFSRDMIETFLRSVFAVSSQADRMGYRLTGPAIQASQTHDIISDATVIGSVQVPTDGQPIILLNDAGTSGGYVKLGTIISPDLSRIAQAGPGAKLRFQDVSVSQAHQIYHQWHNQLAQAVHLKATSYLVEVNQRMYRVTVTKPD